MVVKKALSELVEKEVELDFEPVGSEALERLMSSNDWTFEEADTLDFILE